LTTDVVKIDFGTVTVGFHAVAAGFRPVTIDFQAVTVDFRSVTLDCDSVTVDFHFFLYQRTWAGSPSSLNVPASLLAKVRVALAELDHPQESLLTARFDRDYCAPSDRRSR
jgi:hypothetical protein